VDPPCQPKLKKDKLWNLILKLLILNFFMNSGSAIFPELVTVTFIGIRSSNFLHADPPDPPSSYILLMVNPLLLIGVIIVELTNRIANHNQ